MVSYGEPVLPDTVPPLVGNTVVVRVYVSRVKFAVMLFAPFIVTMRGFVEPDASPLQPVNV